MLEDKKKIEELRKRYERLASQLAKLDLIVQGTITERTITKKDPRNPAATRTIGPYYQWTFKRRGKTVTVNLSASQVKPFQKAIDINRKAENLLSKMRELSRKILDASTEGVKRYNSIK